MKKVTLIVCYSDMGERWSTVEREVPDDATDEEIVCAELKAYKKRTFHDNLQYVGIFARGDEKDWKNTRSEVREITIS